MSKTFSDRNNINKMIRICVTRHNIVINFFFLFFVWLFKRIPFQNVVVIIWIQFRYKFSFLCMFVCVVVTPEKWKLFNVISTSFAACTFRLHSIFNLSNGFTLLIAIVCMFNLRYVIQSVGFPLKVNMFLLILIFLFLFFMIFFF